MTRRNPRLWRTERFVVDIPIVGQISTSQLRWYLESAIENGNLSHSLTKYNSNLKDAGVLTTQVGRVRVKSYSRVRAMEKEE